MNVSPCPTPTELRQLLDGNLSTSDESRLLKHLDSCASCQRIVDQDSASITVPDNIAETQLSQNDAEFRTLIERIKSPDWLTNSPETANFDPQSSCNDDRFELLHELGRGGMGVVYLAREKSLDRQVAIKFLSPHLAERADARQRFIREAKAAAAIRDAAAITIHSVTDGSPPFIVMEYVDGETLQERIDLGPIEVEEAIEISRQIAGVLQRAHAINVLHRDIKPANILLESNKQEAKLTDFGLAQIAGDSKLTQSGMLIGTPAYMAPELLDPSSDVDGRADLFSLGAVLYAMLAGNSPFEAGSILSTIRNVAALKADPIAKLRPDVPAWLSSLISDLLEKEPADRPADASEVLQRLERKEAWHPTNPNSTNHRPHIFAKWMPVLASAVIIVALLSLLSVWMDRGGRQPFATTVDDAIVRYESLEEALESAPRGAKIEITEAGPFLVRESVLAKDISIVGAPGVRPVLIFDNTETTEGAMFTTDSSLTLEGLQLEFTPKADVDDEVFTLVRVDGGSLNARKCRFVFAGEDGCCVSADLESESQFLLTDCVLSSWPGEAISITIRDNAQAEFDNCAITGATCFEVESFGTGEIELVDCRLAGDGFLAAHESDEEDMGRISVRSTRSRFHLFESFADIDLFDEESDYEQLAEFSGSENLYVLPDEIVEDVAEWLEESGRFVDSVFEQTSGEIANVIRHPKNLEFDTLAIVDKEP